MTGADKDAAFETPRKLKQSLEEVDDSCSTAVPSVEPSPNSGPLGAPADPFHLDEALLGPALASLGTLQDMPPPEHVQELQLRQRIEWYFSAENLCHDRYLRSRMDKFGWVLLGDMLEAAGLRSVSTNIDDAGAALKASKYVEVSEDLKMVRAMNQTLQAAFAPRDARESKGPLSPRSAVQGEYVPEVDDARGDLAFVEVVDPSPGMRASKEGAALPCVEWLTSEPYVTEECMEWLVSEPDPNEYAHTLQQPEKRRRQRRDKRKQCLSDMPQEWFRIEGSLDMLCVASDSESPPASPTAAAWMRFSDDAYPCAAASLLGW